MSTVSAMIEPSVLRAMLAAGATAEMIVAAVEADYETEEKKKAVKRAQDAERQRKKRRSDTDVSGTPPGVTGTVRESRKRQEPDKEGPPHPPKKTNIPPNEAIASLPPKPDLPATKVSASKASTSKTKAARGRGTRLPEDWRPSETLWAFGQDRLDLDEEVLRFETGAFRDHFRGAPGQKGVKLDWDATWKNWMREAVRRRGRARGGPSANPDEAWRKAVRQVEGSGAGEVTCDGATRGEVTRDEATRGEVTRDEVTHDK